MTESKSEKLCLLEKKINDGKKVILADCEDISFLKLLCEGISKEPKRCSDVELWHHIDGFPESDFTEAVTQKEMDEILEIYRMYDFSDKITVISDAGQYGSMFNYVNNKILTKEEMVEALLCKI